MDDLINEIDKADTNIFPKISFTISYICQLKYKIDHKAHEKLHHFKVK